MAPKSPKKKPSKPSKPRHCRQCPDRPLLSECAHSRIGKAYLKLNKIAPAPNSLESPTTQSSCSPRSSPTPQGYTTTADPPHEDLPPPSSDPPTPPSSGELPLSSIDPRLLDPATYGSPTSPPTLTQATPQTSAQLASGDIEDVNDDDLTNGDHNGDSDAEHDQQEKRNRISKANPTHGHVLGARRGNCDFSVLRTSKLRDPIANTTIASGRFARCMADILVRCEQVANETSCWLFITAQHTTARAPFIHYSSPRILRESKGDMEFIINQFNQIFSKLIAARREDAQEIHGKYLQSQRNEAETKRRLEESIVELENSKQAVERQKKMLEEQAILLAQYKQRITKST